MSRLLARLQRQRLEAEAKAAVNRALEGSELHDEKAPEPESASSETARRRGVPIIGPGSGGGAIRGTQPGRNLK